jgi:hypothetical protein
MQLKKGGGPVDRPPYERFLFHYLASLANLIEPLCVKGSDRGAPQVAIIRTAQALRLRQLTGALAPEVQRGLRRLPEGFASGTEVARGHRAGLSHQSFSLGAHVWTAPSWQGESSRRVAGRCSHVFGLLVRFT